MNLVLTQKEARILGSLIEKEITTPNNYPLTLNSLTLACNQKSNRNPVMQLDEKAVIRSVLDLRQKKLVWEKYPAGSRTPKYAHSILDVFEFSPHELGIICVLLLRGPQTAGEMRTNTSRLCSFNDLSEIASVMERLAEREDGPYIMQLPRQPGRRENRYAHLMCGPVEIESE
ncbi:MAG: YceH family protein, partial [Candidatus Theseobacter exili]|nr:YceH family protein [Candidatus Theseobacter exili]